MFFASDNWAGAHPLIAESLLRSSGRYEIPYGEGEIDRRVERRLSELFERDVRVFLVGTGTAANALSLASQAKPASVIFCHPRAHVMHEGGGVELMTNGGKLVTAFAKRLSAMGFSNLTSKVYAETRHESLNEVNRDVIMQDFVSWAEKISG